MRTDDQERTGFKVLLAAIPQGVIFASVRAALDRRGVAGTRRPTGTGQAGPARRRPSHPRPGELMGLAGGRTPR
ncbi:DUF4235 domain-containing protein [Streptomyces sp. NPDC006458]|uniref:DUF4235 domain-containing protein n=1 Tax=Streptomyces sp. NPDC006458 TaxID=3154302 RepID=UPI0033ABAC31